MRAPRVGVLRTGALWAGALCACTCAAAATAGSAETPAPTLRLPTFTARVTYVVDGDSLWVRTDDGTERLRLRVLGIDAPELCQPGGGAAREALAALVLGGQVRVSVRAHDSYGRSLARVQQLPGGLDVGARLVEDGHAWSDGFRRSGGPYAPEQARARQARRGVFAEARPERPADFRRRHGPCASAPASIP